MKNRTESTLRGTDSRSASEGDALPGLTSACRNLLREAAALGLEFDDVLEALRSSDTDDHAHPSLSN